MALLLGTAHPNISLVKPVLEVGLAIGVAWGSYAQRANVGLGPSWMSEIRVLAP